MLSIDQSQNTITFSTMHLLSEPEFGHCNMVQQPAKLRCTRCKKVDYCSPKHQPDYWKYHKKHPWGGQNKSLHTCSGSYIYRYFKIISLPVSSIMCFKYHLNSLHRDQLRELKLLKCRCKMSQFTYCLVWKSISKTLRSGSGNRTRSLRA